MSRMINMRRQSSPCQNAATRCVIENKTCLHMCLLTLLDCSHQLLLDIFYCSNRILVERVCIQVRGKNGSATSHLTVGRPEKTRPFRGPNFRPFEWGCRWFDGLKKSLGGWKNIPSLQQTWKKRQVSMFERRCSEDQTAGELYFHVCWREGKLTPVLGGCGCEKHRTSQPISVFYASWCKLLALV